MSSSSLTPTNSLLVKRRLMASNHQSTNTDHRIHPQTKGETGQPKLKRSRTSECFDTHDNKENIPPRPSALVVRPVRAIRRTRTEITLSTPTSSQKTHSTLGSTMRVVRPSTLCFLLKLCEWRLIFILLLSASKNGEELRFYHATVRCVKPIHTAIHHCLIFPLPPTSNHRPSYIPPISLQIPPSHLAPFPPPTE